MKIQSINLKYDLVVCGGGMSGICAAIQASRLGLKTALINNRGVLGGNAGPEIRVHICGATGSSEYNLYSREGGIIGEILIENRYRNPQGNVYLFHTVLVDKLRAEANCDVFLNTYIDTVNMNGTSIASVEGTQNGSEKRFVIDGDMFIDDTGDGTIGYLAGAEYMYGREGKGQWGEQIAPNEEDKGVLLSSLSFYSKDFHKKMPFTMPEFAKDITDNFQKTLSFREIPDRIPKDARYDGYRFQWYYETGASKHQIDDNEAIVEDHSKLMYQIWDNIKNHSNYKADQFDIEYVSPVLGKRESRRLVGEYILKEQDIAHQTNFEDAIAYGGWSIDLHAMGGFFDDDLINRHYYLRGIYQIPFRSCCVKGIGNLMVASRCLSVSHVASGTTRIMSTLSMLGQACAVAALLCRKYYQSPKEIAESHIEELQQILQVYDQGIVGKKKRSDIMEQASITTSSHFKGEIPHTNEWLTMSKVYSFIFPVVQENKAVQLHCKAKKTTTLKYTIYKPAKMENYSPEIKLGEFSVKLQKDEEVPLLISLEGLEYENNLCVIFEKNPSVSLEVTALKVNGYQMQVQTANTDDSFVDIETFSPKPYICNRFPKIPVISYVSDLYNGDNLKNGYIRNYGSPNLWLSDIADKKPKITITFDEPKTLEKMSITFDNLCDDFDYDTLEHVYESNVWEQVVKEYDVLAIAEGETAWKTIAKVRGNYQRLNFVDLPKNTYKEIQIQLLKTNGASQFGVYDVDFQ
ncbi:MAG: FAD-dependent oxidoreductase [Bacillota bacterium]